MKLRDQYCIIIHIVYICLNRNMYIYYMTIVLILEGGYNH